MNSHTYIGPDDEPDKYRLHRLCGTGAQGQLWHAFISTQGVDTPVAVKILDPGEQLVEQVAASAKHELDLLQAINFPSVVRGRAVFTSRGNHRAGEQPRGDRVVCLVMDWVDGENLHIWAVDHPARGFGDIAKIVTQLVGAVAHLHSGRNTGGQPVLHRDLKPSNVIVSGDTVTLVDFGLAHGGWRPPPAGGTAGYVAPELDPTVGGTGRPSKASDLYGLAGIVYYCFVGKPPPDDHSVAVVRSELAAVPLLAGYAPLVDHIVTGFDPNPDTRPSNVEEWGRLFGNHSTIAQTGSTGPVPVVEPAFSTASAQAPSPARLPGSAGVADRGSTAGRGTAQRGSKVPLFAGLAAFALLAAGTTFWLANREPDPSGASAAPSTTLQEVVTTTVPPTTAEPTTTVRPTTTTSTTRPPTTTVLSSTFASLRITGSRDTSANINGITYLDSYVSDMAWCTRNDVETWDFDLGRRFTIVNGVAGITDESAPGDTMRGRILVDGAPAFEADFELGQSTPFTINVTNALRLQFEVRSVDDDCSGRGARFAFGDPTAS